MVRSLIDKVDNMQEQIGNVRRDDGDSQKEIKRNAGDLKHCNRNKECL